MPKLWNDTIEEHRHAVREATLDSAAALVADHGLTGVTMSRIAKETGLGRATLYKYFPDVEAILVAWHERQVGHHLQQLAAVRDHARSGRLAAVLEAYALISYQHPATELAASLHRAEHVAEARQQLRDFLTELLVEGVAAGEVRDDVPPGELATYSLQALSAATGLASKTAVRRLVGITLDGLRHQAVR